MNPQVIEHDDGLDIVIDSECWHTETSIKDNKTYIKFRKSNGKNPLTIKNITGVDLGKVDQKLLGMSFTVD